MSIRKLLFAMLVAAVLAAGATFLVWKKNGAAADAAHAAVWKYVASSRDIGVGELISADLVTLIDWNSPLPVDGAITDTKNIVGRVASVAISRGMVITEKMLTSPNSQIGLPTKIPTGMRAIAVQTDQVADLGGFLFPGAHVDVLETIKDLPFGAKESGAPARIFESPQDHTVTILENVQVLSTGKEMVADPTGKPAEVPEVTLLVTPEDARKVELAKHTGVLNLALRNSSDLGASTLKETSLSDLVGTLTRDTAPKAKPQGKKKVEPPATVEIVLGTHVSSERFANNMSAQPAAPAPQLGGKQRR